MPEINIIQTHTKNKSNKNSHLEVKAHSYLNDSPMEESIQLKEIYGYLPGTFGSRFQWRQVNGEGKREIGGFVGVIQCLNLCWSHNTKKCSRNQ